MKPKTRRRVEAGVESPPSSPDPIDRPNETHLTLDPAARDYYRDAMTALDRVDVRYMIGGAYAMAEYAGIVRHTKDFDLFVLPQDRDRALAALATVSDRTEVLYAHWLGKAWRGDFFVDLIFSSANGLERVDDDWFRFACDSRVLGQPVKLIPREEMIWQKAFVMERERFDGADIAHLLRAQSDHIDWDRLLARFGPHWRILYVHLILFGFVYPCERDCVPSDVLDELTRRLKEEMARPAPEVKVCQGTLLSRLQYLLDVERSGFRDGRMWPEQLLTVEDLAIWTAGIWTEHPTG